MLSPAYDLVSTIPYIPNDRLALNFAGVKAFGVITRERFRILAEKAVISEHETLSTVDRIIDAVQIQWPKVMQDAELPEEIANRIDLQISSITQLT